MFTGLVEALGTVRRRDTEGGIVRVRIDAPDLAAELARGDSISVSGCCLTAVAVDPDGFEVELTEETLRRTAPRWSAGDRVNLERALRVDARLDGHLVAGHVEGVGEVARAEARPGATVLTVRAPEALAAWLVPKGSITVDGVSLTVVDVGGPIGTRGDLAPHEFTVWGIPHTLEHTTLGALAAGHAVNLEADLMARYAARAARVLGTTTTIEDAREGEGEVADGA